jgi:DNA-binding PadR family transcriptional regulator
MKETDPSSKFAVLGMLSICPGSGYDIRKMVQASIGYFWNESYGRIYPLLKELARDGLVRPERQEKSARARQSYAITKKGLQALEQWLEKTPRVEPNRSELLLKIFFCRLVPEAISSAHVQERRELEKRHLASYDQVEESLRREHARDPALPYWLATISYGRHRSRAIVEWCDETLESLSQISQETRERGKK